MSASGPLSPTRVRQYGDIGQAAIIKTVDINITTSTDTTIYSPSATKLFLVYFMHLVNDHATADSRIIFKSGSTIIGREELQDGEKIDLVSAGGLPVLRGRVIDEDFVITTTGGSPGTVKGWAQIGEVAK